MPSGSAQGAASVLTVFGGLLMFLLVVVAAWACTRFVGRLEGTDLPIPGEDFIVTGELTVRGRAAMFSLDEIWRELLPFLREVSGNEYLNTGTALRCYGTYELAGSSFLCLVTSPTVTTRHQDQSLVMDHVLLAETGTGRLYQYGYERDRYAVLVRSPHLLPPEALEQLLALPPAPPPS